MSCDQYWVSFAKDFSNKSHFQPFQTESFNASLDEMTRLDAHICNFREVFLKTAGYREVAWTI